MGSKKPKKIEWQFRVSIQAPANCTIQALQSMIKDALTHPAEDGEGVFEVQRIDVLAKIQIYE